MELILNDPSTLDDRTFKRLCDLIYEKCGIVLTEDKRALVQARVGKRMRQTGFSDYRKYYDHLTQDASGDELVGLLDVISTNVTHFFREGRHFEKLGALLREWQAAGQRRYRIWCSAASTGEEPYTIAITVHEALENVADAKILATDISTRVLRKAKEGRYLPSHMEKVPPGLVGKYFQKEKDAEGDVHYVVKDSLKAMVTFGRINLAKPPFPLKGPLDVILCRNVMIYFDNLVRSRMLDNFHSLLRHGGYLIVGHAESLSGMLNKQFKPIEPAVYMKK